MNAVSEIIALLGATPGVRFEFLLGIAKEMGARKDFNVNAWKRTLSKNVAQRLERPTAERRIYGFLSAMDDERLGKLREAAVGKEASDEIIRKAKEKVKSTLNRRLTRSASSPTHPFEIALESLEASHHNLKAVADACNVPMYQVVSYAFQNATFRKKLMDGDQVFTFRKKRS